MFDENKTSEEDGMVAYATTSYNTGWMQGDIKGAFLSDTDTTNVTGSELITNGTFASDVSGWTTGTSTITIILVQLISQEIVLQMRQMKFIKI